MKLEIIFNYIVVTHKELIVETCVFQPLFIFYFSKRNDSSKLF